MKLVPAFLAAFALGVDGKKKGKGRAKWSQNCAALGRCNIPLEYREPSLNAAPPGSPKGHFKPIGHEDFLDSWGGEVEVLHTDPTPEEFWTKFWPRKPFLLKGWAQQSPAFKNWVSDEYVTEHYGHFKAKTENKNEDRLTDYCHQVKFGEMVHCSDDILPYVESYMKIEKFVEQYKSPTFDKYIITQMPDEMGREVQMPNFFMCGKRPDGDKRKNHPYMTRMYEHNLWLNYNEGLNFSSSVIHYDMNHQIMCQITGAKEWFFWDLKDDIDHIPMWSEYYQKSTHTAMGSDDSPIDGERVDLVKFPNFAKAKWYNTTMYPGDCLYTPALSLHYVRTTGRALAVMTMFQTEERYDAQCDVEAAHKANLTMADYDVMWSFPEEDPANLGWNMVKMGFPNWKRIYQGPLAQYAEARGGLTVKQLAGIVKKWLEGGWNKQWSSRVKVAFKGATESDKLTAEDVWQSKPIRWLLKDVAIHAEGGGRGDQEEGETVERYSLAGDGVRRYKHDEM